jgi:thiol-disulfide isomerase/thioredoxin
VVIKKLLLVLILLMASSNIAIAVDGIVLRDLSGKQQSLSLYAGKWLIINYWATWCPPCLEEVPELVALYDDRKGKDLMVIGVVFDYETVEEVKRYADDMLMSYPIVLGNKAVTKQIGSAEVLPTTYIFNPQGKLLKVKHGIVSRQYLETMMQAN